MSNRKMDKFTVSQVERALKKALEAHIYSKTELKAGIFNDFWYYLELYEETDKK